MRRGAVIVAGIAAVALVLRVTGLDFGLPAVYNPDEVAILSRALAFAKGDPNPHNFLYPTFYFYALFAWLGGYFVLGRLTGQLASLHEFQQRFFVDPSSLYLASRFLSAVCGAATTVATMALGKALFDRPTALAAAALLAVSPLAVQDAHYVKHDVPVTLLITLALWRLARCWPEGGAAVRVSSRHLLVGAALCGAAFSTHYYSVFLALPLVLTIWQARREEGAASVLGELARQLTAAGLVFLALSPFLLVEPATAWRDVVANRQIVVDRAASAGLFANLQRYVVLLATLGTTIPVAVLAVAGALLLIATDRRRALLLLSFPVGFMLFIANTVPASRYLNPVLPVVMLLSAVAIRHIARRLPWRTEAGMAGLTLLVAVLPFWNSVVLVRFFGQTDTRTLAQHFLERTAPAGATVLVQPYSVVLTQSRESLEESLRARLGTLDRLSTRARLRLAVSPWPAPAYRLLWLGDGGLDEDKMYVGYGELRQAPLDVLRARGIDYVVLKRFDAPDPAVAPLAAALARGARKLATISPFVDGASTSPPPAAPFVHNADATVSRHLQRPGPIIDIYQLE